MSGIFVMLFNTVAGAPPPPVVSANGAFSAAPLADVPFAG